MIAMILVLVIIGVALYMLRTYVPMDPVISTLITVVVVICAVLWLLRFFGVADFPVPTLR